MSQPTGVIVTIDQRTNAQRLRCKVIKTTLNVTMVVLVAWASVTPNNPFQHIRHVTHRPVHATVQMFRSVDVDV